MLERAFSTYEQYSRSVLGVRNRKPSVSPPGVPVGSGIKQLQAEDTLEAMAAPSVDFPTQFAAQDAVPVAANEFVPAV